PNVAYIDAQLNDIRSAAADIGREIVILNASTIAEIDAAFATLRQKRVDALSVAIDAFFFDRATQIVVLATRNGVTALYAWRRSMEGGGLMSHATTLADPWRQAGIYTGRILKGEKPADLPVLQTTKFEFVINLKTAKALGLTVPPTLQVAADEVIE